jgi:hypothetical protein
MATAFLLECADRLTRISCMIGIESSPPCSVSGRFVSGAQADATDVASELFRLLVQVLDVIGGGGRNRTVDLRVMSPSL